MRCDVSAGIGRVRRPRQLSGQGGAFQAEGTAHAKTQSLGRVWCFGGAEAVKEWGVRRGQRDGQGLDGPRAL